MPAAECLLLATDVCRHFISVRLVAGGGIITNCGLIEVRTEVRVDFTLVSFA